MKRFFLATIAIAALATSSASAADMAVKALPPAPPACAQFGGVYLNGHAGWGYYDHKFNDRDALGAFIDTGLGNTLVAEQDKGLGGVGVGYNWQNRCNVYGLVADWSFTNLRAQALQLDGDQTAPSLTTDTMSVSSRLRWFGTLRARSGLVVDNILLYSPAVSRMPTSTAPGPSSRTARLPPAPSTRTRPSGAGRLASAPSGRCGTTGA